MRFKHQGFVRLPPALDMRRYRKVLHCAESRKNMLQKCSKCAPPCCATEFCCEILLHISLCSLDTRSETNAPLSPLHGPDARAVSTPSPRRSSPSARARPPRRWARLATDSGRSGGTQRLAARLCGIAGSTRNEGARGGEVGAGGEGGGGGERAIAVYVGRGRGAPRIAARHS